MGCPFAFVLFVPFCGYTTPGKEDTHGRQFKVYDHLSLLRGNVDD
jgi:hypothetical protein